MTEFSFEMPYKPKTGPVRIGKAVLEIQSVTSQQAPVALVMPAAPQASAHQVARASSRFRFHDGAYWTEVCYRTGTGVLRPFTRDLFRVLENTSTRADFTASGKAIAFNPFIEKGYGPTDLVKPGPGDPLERDAEPMSRDLLASEAWKQVSAQAGRTILVDDSFHQRAAGPVIYVSLGEPLWTVLDRDTPAWFGQGSMFPYWQADAAAEFYRIHYGKELRFDERTAPVVVQDLRARSNLTALGIERSARSIIGDMAKTPVSDIDIEALSFATRMRRALETRLPPDSLRYWRGEYYLASRHPSETDIPDAPELLTIMREGATLNHRSAAHIQACLRQIDLRAEAMAGYGTDDADALGAAFT